MSAFLGFVPDKNTQYQIKKVVSKIQPIFDGQDIPVRWVEEQNIHIAVHLISDKRSKIKELLTKKKLKGINITPFEISLGRVKLGTVRSHKDMVYASIDHGGEELRNLKYEIIKKLGVKDNTQFVPHISLGRISKDLTKMEYSNVVKDLENISKGVNTEEIRFKFNKLSYIFVNEGEFNILKEYE